MAPSEVGAGERRLGQGVLLAAVGLGAVLRLLLVVGDHSVYWPDEIHKSLEPAHRAAFGYGFRAWEFVTGASNWTFAGLLAGTLRMLSAAGLDDPRAYLLVVRGLLAAASLGAAWAARRLARDHGAGPMAAALAAALVALAAPVVYFSHRALSETASLLPVTLGLALALPRDAGRRALVAGVSLLGFAVLLRLQNGLFLVGLLGVLAARRDRRTLGLAVAVAAGWAVVYGAVDWATWGSPFHSAIEYGRFSLLDGGASDFGTSSVGYYAVFLARSLGPVALPLAALVLVGAWRAPALGLVTAGYVAAHCLEPHKEARFLLPTLPLLAALAGIGAGAVADRLPRRAALGPALVLAVAAAAAVNGVGVRGLTYGRVGQGHLFAPSAPAYEHGAAVNRLLLAAHDRPDLCGIRVEVEMTPFTGGYTYLHRRVPFYDRAGPPRSSGRYNYAIGLWDLHDPGVVATAAGLALTRLASPPCRPDPAFDDRL